jgi:hypothetical protein
MKTKMALGMSLALVVCATAFGCLAFIQESKINAGSFKKIEIGMTRQQVEEILGGPQRDETDPNYRPEETTEEDRDFQIMAWRGPAVTIIVIFDAQNRVLESGSKSYDRITLWDRICTWLP